MNYWSHLKLIRLSVQLTQPKLRVIRIFIHALSSEKCEGTNYFGDTRDDRGEESQRWSSATHGFTMRESPSFRSSYFYEIVAAIENFIFLPHVRYCFDAAHPQHHYVKSCKTSEGRGSTVVAHVDQRSGESLRPGFLSPAFEHRFQRQCQMGENYTSRSKLRAIIKRDLKECFNEKKRSIIRQL